MSKSTVRRNLREVSVTILLCRSTLRNSKEGLRLANRLEVRRVLTPNSTLMETAIRRFNVRNLLL